MKKVHNSQETTTPKVWVILLRKVDILYYSNTKYPNNFSMRPDPRSDYVRKAYSVRKQSRPYKIYAHARYMPIQNKRAHLHPSLEQVTNKLLVASTRPIWLQPTLFRRYAISFKLVYSYNLKAAPTQNIYKIAFLIRNPIQISI